MCTFTAIVRERWCWKHQPSTSRCPSCSGLGLCYKALNLFLDRDRNACARNSPPEIFTRLEWRHIREDPQLIASWGHDDMTTWVCGDYRFKCNVSSLLFDVLYSSCTICHSYAIIYT